MQSDCYQSVGKWIGKTIPYDSGFKTLFSFIKTIKKQRQTKNLDAQEENIEKLSEAVPEEKSEYEL